MKSLIVMVTIGLAGYCFLLLLGAPVWGAVVGSWAAIAATRPMR